MARVTHISASDDDKRLVAAGYLAGFLPHADAIVVVHAGVIAWHGNFKLACNFARFFVDPEYIDDSLDDVIYEMEKLAEELKAKVLIVDFGQLAIIVVVRDKPIPVPHG